MSLLLTAQQLGAILPNAAGRIAVYLDPLNAAMDEFEIDTPQRAAAFIGQVAKESLQFKFSREIWGPTGQQLKYERLFSATWPPTPEDPTNKLAWILGNAEAGDGHTFMGRGLIQLTGRSNYDHCGQALNLDLLNQPELLEIPINACRSAGWFWRRHGLNELADAGQFNDITKAINGAHTAEAERVGYYKAALAALGEPTPVA